MGDGKTPYVFPILGRCIPTPVSRPTIAEWNLCKSYVSKCTQSKKEKVDQEPLDTVMKRPSSLLEGTDSVTGVELTRAL